MQMTSKISRNFLSETGIKKFHILLQKWQSAKIKGVLTDEQHIILFTDHLRCQGHIDNSAFFYNNHVRYPFDEGNSCMLVDLQEFN